MKNLVVIVLAVGWAWNSHANSYVGNGGNEGDVELAVTQMQIREAMQVIQKKDPKETVFCECNRMYQSHSICEPLRALSDEQKTYCSQTLFGQAQQVEKIANGQDAVHIQWTNSPIDVVDGTQHRAADAVANRDKREITVNLPRYLGMRPAERVFLLTHEYLHFTQLDGKPMVDQGAVGPFTGADGARSLIDAMAAATGILQGAFPRELKSYRAKLYRSQAWKTRWFSADVGGATVQSNYSDNFAFNNYFRAQIGFRYQLTNEWGLVGIWRNESQSKTITYNSMDINASENINIFGIGVAYRFFFAPDPLSFWGQSHLIVRGLAEYVKANYSFGDNYNSFSDSAGVYGASVGVDYYLPVFWGFWGYVGASYEYHPYKYVDPTAQLNLNYDSNLISGYMGVAYAF